MATPVPRGVQTDFRGTILPPDFSEVPVAAQRTGVGYLQYSNGVIYEGEWLNGERHGLGVCFYPSGNIFVGQFQSGMMEGDGTMFFATGECFTGEFRHSTIYKGVYSSRGREIVGVWQDGSRISEVSSKAPEVLQRARAALFCTIVEQVNEYLWGAASEPTELSFPSPLRGGGGGGGSGGTSALMRPPSDIPTSCPAGSSPMVATRAPRSDATASFDEANHMYATTRFRGGSLYGEAEGKEVSRLSETQYGPPDTVFTCAAPAPVESFSVGRFLRRFFVFLFPFLSLPYVPFAPLRITTMQEERIFVVSGAALRSDFDAPSLSLCVIVVAMLCQIASIVIVASRVSLGTVQDGDLTLPDMVIPCVLWLVVALVGAAYNAFLRLPHGLERVDRRVTPKLCAFAASIVDAKASVCIFTYDEDGKGKVMNRHYKYRWLLFGVVFGAMLSLSAPATRGGYGHNMFGRDGFTKAATLLAFFATFLFAATLSYFVLKVSDMQREIRAKLHVLTDLAFLERRCLMNPSRHAHTTFDLDEPLDTKDLFTGFPGWYSLRSLILFTSMSGNHGARRLCIGVLWFTMICVYVVALSDTFYMLANHYNGNDQYYSTAHSYAFVAILIWGTLLSRYLYLSLSTRRELRRHLYIMDIAALYRKVKANDAEASDIIQQCRRISEFNDAAPELFPQSINVFVGVLTTLLYLGGLAAICYQLGEAIYY